MLYKQILFGPTAFNFGDVPDKVIQKFQSKVLKNIEDAFWYIRNKDLNRDLEIATVEQTSQSLPGITKTDSIIT